MCQDLVLEETSCLSIRIIEHLPLAITKSLYFGWLLMGGLTVFVSGWGQNVDQGSMDPHVGPDDPWTTFMDRVHGQFFLK